MSALNKADNFLSLWEWNRNSPQTRQAQRDAWNLMHAILKQCSGMEGTKQARMGGGWDFNVEFIRMKIFEQRLASDKGKRGRTF